MITTCGSKIDIRKLVPVASAVAGGVEPAGGGHPRLLNRALSDAPADADVDEADAAGVGDAGHPRGTIPSAAPAPGPTAV